MFIFIFWLIIKDTKCIVTMDSIGILQLGTLHLLYINSTLLYIRESYIIQINSGLYSDSTSIKNTLWLGIL